MDKDLKTLLPKIKKDRHKYEAGFVVGFAGSIGMFGACQLCSLAALRSGAGIVKVITQTPIDNVFYELVNFIMDYKQIDEIIDICNKADSIFIGPGLGTDKKIEKFFNNIIIKLKVPVVIDADGLFHLSKDLDLLLPSQTVLTPHKKEMKRLLQMENIDDESLIKATRQLSIDKKAIIVLKGYPTIIFHPEKEPLIIAKGDPGLATAGAGDVLTGMISSFIAQGLNSYDASILAVNMHFIAAEMIAKDMSSYSLIASDIIRYLPKVFKRVLDA